MSARKGNDAGPHPFVCKVWTFASSPVAQQCGLGRREGIPASVPLQRRRCIVTSAAHPDRSRVRVLPAFPVRVASLVAQVVIDPTSIILRLRAMLNVYPPNRSVAAMNSSRNAASHHCGVPSSPGFPNMTMSAMPRGTILQRCAPISVRLSRGLNRKKNLKSSLRMSRYGRLAKLPLNPSTLPI